MRSPSVRPLYGLVPSERRLRWYKLEFRGFFHFTTNTFTHKEWTYGDESPAAFNFTASGVISFRPAR